MPRGSRRSSRGTVWENQNNNTPNMRDGIPEERRRLLEERGVVEIQDNEEFAPAALDLEDFSIGEPVALPNINYVDYVPITRGSRRGRSSYFTIDSINTNKYKYIKSYNYTPEELNFNKLSNEEELFLGVELEVDKAGKNDDNAKMVIDILGKNNIYCMHDGSLHDGFEITTHPGTLEYHSQLKYEEVFNKLLELDYRSHDTTTCGLHVHFNKNYFGEDKTIQDLCITKLLYLFEKYWDSICKISRRSNVRYAQRYHMNEKDSMFDVLSKAKNSYNKYRAVNLNNENTVEIRTFKGTLKYNTYIATLQFVKRIVKISKNTDLMQIQNITWDDIISNPEKELKQYLTERKLLKF